MTTRSTRSTNRKHHAALRSYVPGWDCHGLPIELQALKERDAKAKSNAKTATATTSNPPSSEHISKAPSEFRAALELRELAAASARRAIELQKQSFLQYGLLGEWERPYVTLGTMRNQHTDRYMALIRLLLRRSPPQIPSTRRCSSSSCTVSMRKVPSTCRDLVRRSTDNSLTTCAKVSSIEARSRSTGLHRLARLSQRPNSSTPRATPAPPPTCASRSTAPDLGWRRSCEAPMSTRPTSPLPSGPLLRGLSLRTWCVSRMLDH